MLSICAIVAVCFAADRPTSVHADDAKRVFTQEPTVEQSQTFEAQDDSEQTAERHSTKDAKPAAASDFKKGPGI